MSRRILLLAVIVTFGRIVTWVGTDRHFYTKFEVVEKVRHEIDAADPLAGTGFYDDGAVETTVTRDEFHLGLIPTPSGLVDKHALSVITLVAPTWMVALGAAWWIRRRAVAAP